MPHEAGREVLAEGRAQPGVCFAGTRDSRRGRDVRSPGGGAPAASLYHGASLVKKCMTCGVPESLPHIVVPNLRVKSLSYGLVPARSTTFHLRAINIKKTKNTTE